MGADPPEPETWLVGLVLTRVERLRERLHSGDETHVMIEAIGATVIYVPPNMHRRRDGINPYHPASSLGGAVRWPLGRGGSRSARARVDPPDPDTR